MLFTRSCPGCRRPARGICGLCRRHLATAVVDPADLHDLALETGLDRIVALWHYCPVSRSLVLALKNRSRVDLAAAVAPALAAAASMRPDVVTWVPASRSGQRRRGYDQGRWLAKQVAAVHGVPPSRLLVRADGGGGAARDRAQRLLGPDLRVGLRAPARVLLVDDVVTTGGSLAAAAAALRSAGAVSVEAVVLAVAEERTQLRPRGRAPSTRRSRRLDLP